MNNSINENSINVSYLENEYDYFALINEVNKSKTLLEILDILNSDYSQKKISLFRYELFIGHLNIAIRYNELDKLYKYQTKSKTL
jgi:hypothetical protein